MRTLLVIIPHADDAALFCGGTLAKRVREGWNVVLARVTNDATDSHGLTRKETVRLNAGEFRDAAAALGIACIEELGYETDTLADASQVDLRERFVYLIRKYRPFAVFTFDPYASYEPNQDHLRVAQTVEESFWVARFDQHYPSHFEAGLAPFAVCEQWYFARRLPHQNWVEDITDHLTQKIAAACAHRVMVANILNQCELLLNAWDGPIPDAAREAGQADPRQVMESFITQQATLIAREAGLAADRMAEVFRVVRFGDLAGIFEAWGFDTLGGVP